jgi:rhamnosyltransferase
MCQLQNKFPKVAAVVILYNPTDSVVENIRTYINQVSKLFILDNSSFFNQKIKQFCESYTNAEYIPKYENLGVAYALNLSAERAVQFDYDYLLTMDQDSTAPYNLVESLLSEINNLKNVGLISPLHSNLFDTHKKLQSIGSSKVNTVMTSGNLLSLEAYNKVGGFNENFFIDYVDVEYCLRLQSKNYDVYRLSNVVLEHNEANLSEVKIFTLKFYPTNNAPIRLYYKTRNLLYLNKMYGKVYRKILREEQSVFIRNFVKILLFERQKFLKFKMMLLGFFDYLKGKRGRKF